MYLFQFSETYHGSNSQSKQGSNNSIRADQPQQGRVILSTIILSRKLIILALGNKSVTVSDSLVSLVVAACLRVSFLALMTSALSSEHKIQGKERHDF